MLWLPGLRRQLHVPISTAGAAQVAEGLLREGDSRRSLFLGTIAEEPSLALWAVCQAELVPGARTVGGLAEWLAANADEKLIGCRTESTATDGPVDWAAPLAAKSITVARLAGQLASKHTGKPDPDASDSPAYLLGLLHTARSWLAPAADSEPVIAEELTEVFPDWLTAALRELESTDQPAELAGHVKEAQRRLLKRPLGVRQTQLIQKRWQETGHFDLAAALPDIASVRNRLAALERDFAAQLEREKLSSLRELAYGASHEINNPLANISTRAQTMLRDERDPDRRKKLATISTQAFRAHEMISDMMLFAKPPEICPSSVSLEEIINAVISELAPAAAEQGTALEASYDAKLDPVFADPTQMSVAIKALIQNSIEAIDLGGKVQVLAKPISVSNEPWFEVVVADSGPGISSDVRPHLFDPFFSGREAGRGLGLGLSKCWRIVELHCGVIDVADGPLGGAQFTIRLPAEQPPCPRIRTAG